jgi:hypothetical protein
MLLAMAGVVALALRPDWKQQVSDRVDEVRSRRLPQVQELVKKPLRESAEEPRVPRPKPVTSRELIEEASAIATASASTWRPLVPALRPNLPVEVILVQGEVSAVENDHAVLAAGIMSTRTE